MDEELTRLYHSLDPEDAISIAEFHLALQRRGLTPTKGPTHYAVMRGSWWDDKSPEACFGQWSPWLLSLDKAKIRKRQLIHEHPERGPAYFQIVKLSVTELGYYEPALQPASQGTLDQTLSRKFTAIEGDRALVGKVTMHPAKQSTLVE